MAYEPLYYRVEDADLMRPDMISFKSYGTVSYWWLILFVNGVHDPFFDLVVSQLLDIPQIYDIYDFYKKYAIR